MTAIARTANWRRHATVGYVSVAVIFGLFGGWSCFARLDSAAVADGIVAVESDRKAVQHLEGGIVSKADVKDGQRVAQGQILLTIESVQAKAGRDGARTQYLSALADEARWTAESTGESTMRLPADLAGTDADTLRAVVEAKRALADHRAAMASEVGILRQRIEQSMQERGAARAKAEGARLQVASLDAEMATLRTLVERGLVARSRVTLLERGRLEQQAAYEAMRAEANRLDRGMDESRLQIEQVAVKAKDDASVRIADARNRVADARLKGTVTGDAVTRSDVRAPRAGRIVNLKVHSVGQVVKPGETIMEIVPEADTLIVVARMSPDDVVRVAPGLDAEVRFRAFKSRVTPVAVGKVISVSADAISDETGRRAPYYEVKVSVQTAEFPSELRAKLMPGLPADVFVATGARTVMAYLAQPLGDAFRKGMRED